MKADMAGFLAEEAAGAKVKTRAALIAFNEAHKAKEMPYFGQEHFLKAQEKGGLDSKEYLDALAANHKLARTEGIDKALADNNLDALIAPTGSPAWLTDFIQGDFSGGRFAQPAPGAGYPHITVPARLAPGMP